MIMSLWSSNLNRITICILEGGLIFGYSSKGSSEKPVSLLIQWYFFWTEYFTSLFANISNCALGDRFLYWDLRWRLACHSCIAKMSNLFHLSLKDIFLVEHVTITIPAQISFGTTLSNLIQTLYCTVPLISLI